MYDDTVVMGLESAPAEYDPNAHPGWGELFWIAFERSTAPMWISRDDHVFVAVNRALCDLTGYEPEQLLGELTDGLLPANWRKVRERDDEALRDLGALDARREVLHASGLRLRLRLAARRTMLAGQWVRLWTVLGDAEGGCPIPDSDAPSRALSPRELEVIAGLARGLRILEIAAGLGISPATVTTHVRNASNKLQARSRTHLVSLAVARELIDPNRVLDGVGR